jgi:hypothetical protein
MHSYFAPKPKTLQPSTAEPPTVEPSGTAATEHGEQNENEIFTGYLSDKEESSESDEHDDGNEELTASQIDRHSAGLNMGGLDAEQASFRVRVPPQPKRRKLDVPARVARQRAQEDRKKDSELALKDIEKLICSKREIFEAGRNGLQEYRARAICSHLQMVTRGKRNAIEASQRAAESQGFAANWGGRLVRRWVRAWVVNRDLPTSKRGQHVKAFSLLSDPAIAAELRSYVRSNKWSMNPEKLAEFSRNNMVNAASEKYLRNVVNNEMPQGLKKYLEVELFPRVHLKVGKGISLRTARRWLRQEGFRFLEHKKALYYDGHERPDVVHYRQNIFLPQMEKYRPRLVEYQTGDMNKRVEKNRPDNSQPWLVLLAQDESTAQQNDGKKASWVYEGEHALKKKGVGRGIHQSDVICSTFGWLKDASQSLEYGKNYEGYWTGEMFVKQVGFY